MPTCLNCECDVGQIRRGLCRPCYNQPAVRRRFARSYRGRREGPSSNQDTGRMTAVELDAFVDAQLADPASLPGWWARETSRNHDC